MLTGLIRPHETRTIDVEGHSLADIQAQLDKATPVGWVLTSAPVAMVKGSTLMTATGTIERHDELREIEADTIDALRAKTPPGWKLLSVR
ncbi:MULTISPECIES: hypothetical protein [unclassified Microbacterium]|uniref:hypothetical protein n=1 Tax=unclassified Microbacterium TaxID=2609290 RepID=UPI003016AF60